MHAACTAAAAAARPWVTAVPAIAGFTDVTVPYLTGLLSRQNRHTRGLFASLFKREQTDTPPEYPRHQFSYKLGCINVTDEYRWLSDYDAARPYLQQEARYYEATTRQWAHQAHRLLQELRHHAAASQHDDPPEQVGSYKYCSHHNPHGPDTVSRWHATTGQQEVVLSADIMQEDAARLTRLLNVPVQGSQLGGVKLSRDQQLLAYSLEMEDGSEQYCCVARHIATGTLLAGSVLPSVSSFEWSADSSCIYYCRPDQHGRPSKVFLRNLEHWQQQQQHSGCEDDLLFSEEDAKHFVTLTRTKDWRYLLINTHSKLSSEVHIVDPYDSAAKPVCIQPRTPGLEYFVEHHHGHLLILTNLSPPSTAAQSCATSGAATGADAAGAAAHSTAGLKANKLSSVAAGAAPSSSANSNLTSDLAADGSGSDYSLMALPAAAAGTAGTDCWQVLVPAKQDGTVIDMDVFESCIVLYELHHARPALRMLQLTAQHQQQQGTPEAHQLAGVQVVNQQQVHLPEWAFAMRAGINQDYYSSSIRLYASNPVLPEVPMELNLGTGQLQQLETQQQQTMQQGKQQQSCNQPLSYRPAAASAAALAASQQQPLECKRLWATARDGVQVPVTLLHGSGLQYDGQAPLLVEVYGAYGQVLEADFRPHRLALLARGWAVALAHVRGGGECGRRWHAAGRQLQKPNSVSDLLACLQLLVELQVSSPGRIAGHAASAGGLTLAAAVNLRPDWFSAVVLEAPFVDWCGSVGDAGLEHLLTKHETDEWGDPLDPAIAEMISSLCPYNNLKGGLDYPAVLLTAGLKDNRVPFWMPLKYAAKLRSLQHAGGGAAAHVQEQQRKRLVLLQFAEDAGHLSIGQLGGSLEDISLEYAFVSGMLAAGL